jgi:mannose-6-phosphate isomerase-like protein (cupin superfamily)
MSNDLRADIEGRPLEELHLRAEAQVATFKYVKPADKDISTKGFLRLVKGELVKGIIQVVKKDGGENNLHYHTNVETFWYVLKGRARFYGPGDVLLGDFGPGEGIVTPRYTRYWFESGSDEDLELLQVAASDAPGNKSGRTDVTPKLKSFEGPRIELNAPAKAG